MYETNSSKNILPIEKISMVADELDDSSSVSNGDVNNDVSNGDNGESIESVSGGDVSNGDVSSGDANTNSVKSSTGNTVQMVSQDYSESLAAIHQSINALNSLLVLIFIFLICEWTEKKISLGVRKFSRERRK